MPDNVSLTPNEKDLAKITSGVSTIAGDVDFKPYLDAVISASQRARSILYILVVTLIAVFAAWRNTALPDWLDVRLQQLQTAYSCLRDGNVDSKCESAIKYARDYVYAPSPISSDATPFSRTVKIQESSAIEEIREFRYAIDMLMKQRTENLSIRFPILGLAMDMNDLGLISGVALCTLLYIFRLTLTREEDNLARAFARAEESRKKDNFELLLMAQLFSAPPKAKTGTNRSFHVFFIVPILLYICVVWSDLLVPKSWQAGSLLLGTRLFVVQVGSEGLFLIGIIVLSAWSWNQWTRNDNLLANIQIAHDSCDARWRSSNPVA
jgi:hypothetical protein